MTDDYTRQPGDLRPERQLRPGDLELIATASVAPASDAHLILLLRARQAIITWRAGEDADRQVASDIDAALETLGFEAQFYEYELETWPFTTGPLAGWTQQSDA